MERLLIMAIMIVVITLSVTWGLTAIADFINILQ